MRARPESFKFPKVWMQFVANDPDTGYRVEYRIQDIPEKYFGAVLDQLVTHYYADEPLSKALNLVNDKISMDECKEMAQRALAEKLSIGCFREGSSELIGFHILSVVHKNESKIQPKGRKREVFESLIQKITDRADIFNKYEVDRILGDYGLSVDPKYRRLGIATELLKARIQVAKSMGLITSGFFSAISSQKAAIKAGFTIDAELKSHELSEFEVTDMDCLACLSAFPD